MKQLREDVEFERMYEIVEKMGLNYDVSTRSRKVPKRYDDSEVLEGLDTKLEISQLFASDKVEIKRQYLAVIDKIISSGERKFSQADLSFL